MEITEVMNYYKRHIGDYHKKAGRLTMLQHGAYTLLIDACYDREQFPTLEDAYEWCWAFSEAEKEAVRFVLARFWTERSGVYYQSRIEEELAKYQENSEINTRIALEREARKRTERASSCTDEHLTNNHKPRTKNQEPGTKNQHCSNPEQSKPKAGLVESGPKRATRLPADWLLPKEWGEWALQEKPLWSADDVRKVAAMFHDYWTAASGKSASKLDWYATWRNWVRKEPDAPRKNGATIKTAQQQRDERNKQSTKEFLGGESD